MTVSPPILQAPTVLDLTAPSDALRRSMERADGFPPASLWLVDAVAQEAAADRLAAQVLDDEERRRAEAFRLDRDRRCYTAAHVALRLLLGARLGTTARAVRMDRETCPTCGGPHGRPAVAGAGGPHFSLSHSGDLALIAIADTPVGTDVEQFHSLETVTDVAVSLHPSETEELVALPDRDRPAAFARAWSRKESYLKGIGTGLSRDPSLDYVGAGPVPAPGPDGWTLTDVAVPDGYAAAVALRR
ncbi:4'-phosphopantetheinyl transferase superfamily protein [Streptomyces sp. AM 4-1-1]|uniref:4'-phosphopantetheinyl transferase family protein n=1 Tax=Streptomyces sp. AM 4-1-1 TaxID=3028710 RepID=UPI0023BA2AFC|nr:4'-phosphopantetheinyl transferase superfamily protein [Streptomyces sp. AM 4-1-1]WEH35900.1 4'-phosphopantetheinyl transferase superfamily protein [Streptomyces sp. AM 4-1-1]